MFKSIALEVIGEPRLHCESCEDRVEHALKTLPGIGQVRAQASKQRIDVLFDTTMLEPAAITERLGKAGYQTKVVSP